MSRPPGRRGQGRALPTGTAVGTAIGVALGAEIDRGGGLA